MRYAGVLLSTDQSMDLLGLLLIVKCNAEVLAGIRRCSQRR